MLEGLMMLVGLLGTYDPAAPPMEVGVCDLKQIGCPIPSSGWHTLTYACPLADWSVNVPGECPAGEDYEGLIRWWDAETGEWVEP